MLATPQKVPFQLSRPPVTDDELWWLVFSMFGVKLPRVAVCPGHVAPFTAFAHAYFARDSYALWYGSRGTGKSYMLALLALVKSAVLQINVTLLGGSMAQSTNVHEHIEDLITRPNAPRNQIGRIITTEVEYNEGNWIRPLPASPTTVRGPHPSMTLLDEIDEMDKKIYDAAMGQAMQKPNTRGIDIREMTVASSTWQHPVGTFSEVLKDARRNKARVFTWCFREQLKPHGWMEPDFIERKRATVPAEFFRVEYELGEPAGGSRAFDLTKLKEAFVPYPEPVDQRHSWHDDLWVWERPQIGATYSAGADWAKQHDFTVISIARTDEGIRRLVYLRIVNRRSWPEMIGWFNTETAAYHASSAHDATGLGNVVHDLVDERTIKVEMIGQKRTRLLTEYIVAVEQGRYRLPMEVLALYEGHAGTTVDDVYAPGLQGAHLPDEVASMALLHRAAQRVGTPVPALGVPRVSSVADSLAPLSNEGYADLDQHYDGEVYIKDDDSGVATLWLPG